MSTPVTEPFHKSLWCSKTRIQWSLLWGKFLSKHFLDRSQNHQSQTLPIEHGINSRIEESTAVYNCSVSLVIRTYSAERAWPWNSINIVKSCKNIRGMSLRVPSNWIRVNSRACWPSDTKIKATSSSWITASND